MLDVIKITKSATEAMEIADRRTQEIIGKVENAALILEKTGLDVRGYTRIIDNYGVRHTMKQHGNEVQEIKRGQIAVTWDDFSKIALITSEPDDIFLMAKTRLAAMSSSL
ncbi:MAG: hypothetical protein PSV24_00245 [Rhodoferax sp.]|nr:hypothetical protein [Rhodoferax sp.]